MHLERRQNDSRCFDTGGYTQKCWNREMFLCLLKRNQKQRKKYRNQIKQDVRGLVSCLEDKEKRIQDQINRLKRIVFRKRQIKQQALSKWREATRRCQRSKEIPDIDVPELIDLTIKQIQNERSQSNRAERKRESQHLGDSDLCSDDEAYPKRRIIQQINKLKRNESKHRRIIHQTLNRWRKAARAPQDRWKQRQRSNESPDVPELRESNRAERKQFSRPSLMECECGSSNLREFVCVPCDHRTMKCTECRQCIRPCACDRVQYRACNNECCPLGNKGQDPNEGLNGYESDVSNKLEQRSTPARKQMDTLFYKNIENAKDQEVCNEEQSELQLTQKSVRWSRRKIV